MNTDLPTGEGWPRRALRLVGDSIERRPWLYFLVSIALCAILSVGFLTKTPENNVRDGYTPLNVRSRDEFKVFRRFFGGDVGGLFWMFVYILPKGNSSLIEPEPLAAARELSAFISNELSVPIDNSHITYRDFCGSFCNQNSELAILETALQLQRSRLDQNKSLSPTVEVDYPIMTIPTAKVNLGDVLFGVESSQNDSTDQATKIGHVSLISLRFFAAYQNDSEKRTIDAWERSVATYLQKSFSSETIRVIYQSDEAISLEVVRAGAACYPYTGLGFGLTLLFVAASVSLGGWLAGDWHWGRVLVAAAAVLSPIAAVAAALGLIFLLGCRFGSILSAVPLLVLAIGVDDAFLMIHAWQQQGEKDGRLGAVFAGAVPSMGVTSATNALAFAIGALTPTPEIRLLCLGAAVSIALDFLLQLTLFAPILVLAERLAPKLPHAGGKKQAEILSKARNAISASVKQYSKWLTTWQARAICGVLLTVLWTASVFGVARMEVSLGVEKLYLSDSWMKEVHQLEKAFHWNERYKCTVFVSKPPNFHDQIEYNLFLRMVSELESLPYAIGASATQLWLNDFREFESNFGGAFGLCDEAGGNHSFCEDVLPDFFDWHEFRKWNAFVHRNSSTPTSVEAFFFTTAYKNVSSWAKRTELMVESRKIADSYGQFDVSIYEHLAFFYDQILTLRGVTIRTVIVTIGCMTAICFVFVPNPLCTAVASLSIISISLGVFGGLGWWRVDLDPISMASTLMAVGFSVDYVAHVSYHFYASDCTTAENRVAAALQAVSWPMVQAALSTVICISAFTLVNSYMAHVFLKTVVLVVSLGVLHGAFLVPLSLTSLPHEHTSTSLWVYLASVCSKSRRKVTPTTTITNTKL